MILLSGMIQLTYRKKNIPPGSRNCSLKTLENSDKQLKFPRKETFRPKN